MQSYSCNAMDSSLALGSRGVSDGLAERRHDDRRRLSHSFSIDTILGKNQPVNQESRDIEGNRMPELVTSRSVYLLKQMGNDANRGSPSDSDDIEARDIDNRLQGIPRHVNQLRHSAGLHAPVASQRIRTGHQQQTEAPVKSTNAVHGSSTPASPQLSDTNNIAREQHSPQHSSSPKSPPPAAPLKPAGIPFQFISPPLQRHPLADPAALLSSMCSTYGGGLLCHPSSQVLLSPYARHELSPIERQLALRCKYTCTLRDTSTTMT